MDAETLLQRVGERGEEGIAGVAAAHQEVDRQGVLGGAHTPDMQVVHLIHPGWAARKRSTSAMSMAAGTAWSAVDALDSCVFFRLGSPLLPLQHLDEQNAEAPWPGADHERDGCADSPRRARWSASAVRRSAAARPPGFADASLSSGRCARDASGRSKSERPDPRPPPPAGARRPAQRRSALKLGQPEQLLSGGRQIDCGFQRARQQHHVGGSVRQAVTAWRGLVEDRITAVLASATGAASGSGQDEATTCRWSRPRVASALSGRSGRAPTGAAAQVQRSLGVRQYIVGHGIGVDQLQRLIDDQDSDRARPGRAAPCRAGS